MSRKPAWQELVTQLRALPQFSKRGQKREVEITEAMAAFAAEKWPTRPLHQSPHREAVEVTWGDLLATACELDRLEAEGHFLEPGHWYERLSGLKLALLGEKAPHEAALHIDGLFHLVGVLGVGKSTLIWVLTYHLACREDKHIQH